MEGIAAMKALDKENETNSRPQEKLAIPHNSRFSKKSALGLQNCATVTKKTKVSVKQSPMHGQKMSCAIQNTLLFNRKPLPVMHKVLTNDQNTDTARQQTPRAGHKAAPAEQNAPTIAHKTPPITQKTPPCGQNTALKYRVNIPVEPNTPQFPARELSFSRVSKTTLDTVSCSLTPLFHRLQLRDEQPERSAAQHMGAQTEAEKCEGLKPLPTENINKQQDQSQNKSPIKQDMSAQTDEDLKQAEQLAEDTAVEQVEQHSVQRGEQLTEDTMETGTDEKRPMPLGQFTTAITSKQSEQCTQQPQDEAGAMHMEAQTDLDEQEQLWQYIAKTVDKQCTCGASGAEFGYRRLYERATARIIELQGIEEEQAEMLQLVRESVDKQNAMSEKQERVESLAGHIIQDLRTQTEEKNLQLEESTQMLDNARVLMKTLCDQLRAKAERLRQDLHNTSEQLSQERMEWAAVQLRLEDERSVQYREIKAARDELTLLRGELETAREQLATEQGRVRQLTEERCELTLRLENMQFLEAEYKYNMEELQAREQQILNYEERLKTACHELKMARKADSAARDETLDARSEALQLQHEAAVLRKDLHAKEMELQSMRNLWEVARVQAEQEMTCLQKCIELQQQLQKSNEELAQERREQALAQIDIQMLKDEVHQLAATEGAQSDKAEDWLSEKIQLKQELNRVTHMKLEKEFELEEQNKRYRRHRYVLEENEKFANRQVTKLQSLVSEAMEILLVVPPNVLECTAIANVMALLSNATDVSNGDCETPSTH